MQVIDTHADPSASHNCYAYTLHAGGIAKCTDDGEPSGTAGRPILAAIQAEGLDEVVVLVVRYYGGVKLGAGGLTRAYGQAARECLRSASKMVRVPQSTLTMHVPFDQLGAVHAVLNQAGVVQREEAYDAGGRWGVGLGRCGVWEAICMMAHVVVVAHGVSCDCSMDLSSFPMIAPHDT